MSEREKLFEKFPPVSREDWMGKIISDLKGKNFHKKLVWKTIEGFEVMPFYRREDIQNLSYIDTMPGQEPFLRGSSAKNNSWLTRQNIEVSDYKEANSKVLDILMKGVDSLGIIIKDPDTINKTNLENLLKGIHFESVEINFLSEGKAKEILEIWFKIIEKSGSDINRIKGTIEADPLSRLMLNGKLCISYMAGLDYLADLTKKSLVLPGLRTVQVNATNFTNAGADVVKELAFALSMGNEYLSVLTERDISPDAAASKIKFSFGIGSNYFFEIAKLRAARLLWSAITGGYNSVSGKNKRMEIHSVTGEWNKTLYDPYVNLLRTQTEAMSASLGGADSITTDPFDKVSGKPTDFSERIARNQQLLLKEEAYFDKVADPAGGSYYIEMLTSMIADSAWKLFLEIEEGGGFTEALNTGFIDGKLKAISERRVKKLEGNKGE